MLIVEYDPKWIEQFIQIKDILQGQLPDTRISIEHVGSTAVPQLAAKPIIDIDLIFYEDSDFTVIKNALIHLSYYHNGDQGIPNREVFKRSKSGKPHPVLDEISHHLYVCPEYSEELSNHIIFRDYLIKNSWAREKYASMKRQIAEQANQDRKIYAEVKQHTAKEFVQKIINGF